MTAELRAACHLLYDIGERNGLGSMTMPTLTFERWILLLMGHFETLGQNLFNDLLKRNSTGFAISRVWDVAETITGLRIGRDLANWNSYIWPADSKSHPFAVNTTRVC
jgi:hypothetical protein